MSLAAVRTALAAALLNVTGIDRSSAYATDQINPVLAMVTRDETDYRQVMDPLAPKHTLKVVVWCGRTNPERADALFDQLADPSNLKATVEGDAGLQAVCDFAEVLTASGPKAAEAANVAYLVCEFPINIVIS